MTLSILIVEVCFVFHNRMAGRGRDDTAIAEALGMLAGVLGGNPNVVGVGVCSSVERVSEE